MEAKKKSVPQWDEGINLLCVVQHEIWQRVIYVYYDLLALCYGIS